LAADAGPAPPGPRPPLRGWRDVTAHVLSVWFGCGHMPVAPGLTGTLGAIPLYLLLRPHGHGAVAAAAVVVTLVGIWASGRVERRLGRKDPQIVCIDEVAGVLVTWIVAPPTTRALVAGVIAFRPRCRAPGRRRRRHARRRGRRRLGRRRPARRPRPRLALILARATTGFARRRSSRGTLPGSFS
jgi:phosphatidylglycerophosphatase A